MGSAVTDCLRIEKLNGSNYSIWKFKLRMMLMRDELWDVVESSMDSGMEAAQLVQWRRKDNRALATICLSVDDSQMVHVKDATSAREAWSKLKDYHEKSSLTSRLFLRKKLMSLRMDRGGDIESHVSKVILLVDQLRACGDAISENEVVTVLLCSLPEEFDSLITALESRESNLTLDYVKQRLQHESLKQSESDKKEESAFKASRGGFKKFSVKDGDRNGVRKEKRTCYGCGLVGHLKRDCRKKSEDKRVEAKKANASSDEFCFHVSDQNKRSTCWFIDSGATNHMSANQDQFENLRKINRKVYLADDRGLNATGIGEVVLHCETGSRIRLKDVLLVPELGSSLLSVSKVVKNGFQVLFKEDSCSIEKDGVVALEAKKINGLYTVIQSTSFAGKVSTYDNELMLWHRRLGHINPSYVRESGVLVKSDEDDSSFSCASCLQGKMTRKPFPAVPEIKTTRILELVHSDVCGPMRTESTMKKRFFVTFIDDFSRMCAVYVIRRKSDVIGKFIDFHQFMTKSTDQKLSTIRCDNGGEFKNHEFQSYCRRNGISVQFTTPYSPQQNGVAERANRYLMEMARTMLIDAGMPNQYWAESVLTACYLKNRTPSRTIKMKSPYEVWYGSKPDLSNLHIFGCTVYSHVPDENRSKLDPKATKCKFLGYEVGVKGFRLLEESSGKIIVSRDIKCIETKVGDKVEKSSSSEEVCFPAIKEESVQSSTIVRSSETSSSVIENGNQSNVTTNEPARRSTRENKGVPPARFDEELIYAYLTSHIATPKSYQEAITSGQSEKWIQACKDEYESLVKNDTWQLCDLPERKQSIPLKWVFQLKCNEDNVITRYKARIVAKGFHQSFGSDYDETFSPVARFTTMRTILSIAAYESMFIEQLDVTSAFLQGNIDTEIYVDQPEGFVNETKLNQVYRLKKSLYGLKQAPRQWNKTLNMFLEELGFHRCEQDWCAYVKANGQSKSFILVYVDDMILASSSESELVSIKSHLESRFVLKLLGPLKFFLGIHFIRDEKKKIITMSQKNYIQKILERFNMENSKPVATPMATGTYISNDIDSDTFNFPYREAVGCVMFVMVVSRPDIAYVVGLLSRNLDKPRQEDLALVKRLLRYLQGTKDLVLSLGGDCVFRLVAFVDSDWAGDLTDRKSTSGFVLKLGTGSILWTSKKQATVSASTTEAEYVAAATAAMDIIWMRALLASLGSVQSDPSTLFEDNQACISIATNPKNHGRIKHVDIKFHFLRNRIELGDISIVYCPTDRMLADIFTKALAKDRFLVLRENLGLAVPDSLKMAGV